MRTATTLATILTAALAAAAPPAATMYADAMSREKTLRTAMGVPDAAPAVVLADVRAVVHAYELLVRQHPTNGYSDNALWQAGRLSLDAFARFGDTADRDAGLKLLKRLVASYPTSRLAKQAADQLARLDRPVDLVASASKTAAPPKETAAAPPAPAAAAPASIATIKAIRRDVLPDAVRITIELDGQAQFRQDRIPDPSRVFVDFSGTRAAPNLVDQTLRFDVDADVVRQVRIGRHPNNTTRVVLDTGGVATYSVYPLYEPFRIVIDCVRGEASGAPVPTPKTSPAPPPAPAPAPAPVPVPLRPRRLTMEYSPPLPSTAPPPGARLIADALAAPEAAPIESVAGLLPQTPPVTQIPAIAPPKHVAGGPSMARQLGLGISRIVIDPGHGGHDPGAKGKDINEAELVLDVALRLEKLLAAVPGVEVVLTRRTDDFVPLQERTAIANREAADLFLSIHANANSNGQGRGVETYFLNFANNLSAAAVAARENAASGQTMGALPDFVKAIALNNKLDESREFARQVQHAMIERLRPANKTIRDLGVKQAPFVVLIGAAMPSVLTEVSFVTNPQEAKLLKGAAYRQRIADALFNAIRKYQTSLKAATAVAHQ